MIDHIDSLDAGILSLWELIDRRGIVRSFRLEAVHSS
jgi:hypothetical protein